MENSDLRYQRIIPTVIESSARGERVFDIYSLLLRERIIFLGSEIDDQIANIIVAQLLYLEHEDADKDIQLTVKGSNYEAQLVDNSAYEFEAVTDTGTVLSEVEFTTGSATIMLPYKDDEDPIGREDTTGRLVSTFYIFYFTIMRFYL